MAGRGYEPECIETFWSNYESQEVSAMKHAPKHVGGIFPPEAATQKNLSQSYHSIPTMYLTILNF